MFVCLYLASNCEMSVNRERNYYYYYGHHHYYFSSSAWILCVCVLGLSRTLKDLDLRHEFIMT